MFARGFLTLVAAVALLSPAFAQPKTEDLIYGRKDGVALTLDVFQPAKPNGAGVIICVSMNFESNKEMARAIRLFATPEFLRRGYVVFAVMHGSQPKFTVPEIVEDIHRAVRFVKHIAPDYGVERERLGIAGGSSGGHLSLMMGCAGRPGKAGDRDPVERHSSRVAAVACFFPPTNFRDFEKKPPPGFDPTVLFPHRERDQMSNDFVIVTAERRRAIGDACSPFVCAHREAAPTLLIHGDRDDLIPIAQSRILDARLTECGAKCKLVEIAGMGHDLQQALPHLPKLADWFDDHLRKK